MTTGTAKTPLHDFLRESPRMQEMYRFYVPDATVLAQVTAALPAARVVAVTESWCPDSRRQVPLMARIADDLPGWTFELLPWDEEARDGPCCARAIPTFIVYDGERELGRIVERPKSSSLELDLLAIAGNATK